MEKVKNPALAFAKEKQLTKQIRGSVEKRTLPSYSFDLLSSNHIISQIKSSKSISSKSHLNQ